MRTLALDFGTRRIGVAITDLTGTLAQPLETIEAPDDEAVLKRIAELVEEYTVSHIVVGLPLHMNGSQGPEAAMARAFGQRVTERTGVPVDYLDERWTSREAEAVVQQTGKRRAKRAGGVDRVAAAILLRTYLERARG